MCRIYLCTYYGNIDEIFKYECVCISDLFSSHQAHFPHSLSTWPQPARPDDLLHSSAWKRLHILYFVTAHTVRTVVSMCVRVRETATSALLPRLFNAFHFHSAISPTHSACDCQWQEIKDVKSCTQLCSSTLSPRRPSLKLAKHYHVVQFEKFCIYRSRIPE